MRTVETTAVVGADHTITVKLPDDIPPGEVRVLVTLAPDRSTGPLFQPYPIGLTDSNFSFRREDLYDDGDR